MFKYSSNIPNYQMQFVIQTQAVRNTKFLGAPTKGESLKIKKIKNLQKILKFI